MIRVGVVGTGWMAAERAGSFARMDGVSVAGICSRDRRKAEAIGIPLGAKAYEDYTAMLEDCDAVAICVPNCLHAEFAHKALARRKHVLVEYPLCTSLEDARELRSSGDRAGRVLMVGNTIIHEAMFRYLIENKPRLGLVLSASSRVAFYSNEAAGNWYMDKERAGPVFSALHYHHIEYYRHLLGNVEWVLSRAQNLPDDAMPGCAALLGGVLTMGHQGGGVSSIQWYLSSKGDGVPRCLWINGSECSVTVVSQEPGRSQVIWDGGGEGKTETVEDEWGVAGSCGDFIDAISGSLNHKTRLDSDIRTLEIGIQASKAAEFGGIGHLDEIPKEQGDD